MAKKKSNEYSADEVDQQNSEAFIDGYAHCYGIAADAIDELTTSINDIMGLYMADDLASRYSDKIAELHLAHTTLRYAMEKISDKYDEEMSQLKDLWKFGGT